MNEKTYTASQVLDAVYRALEQHEVSLWLPDGITCPTGHLHPEDIGHIGNWVVEELDGPRGTCEACTRPLDQRSGFVPSYQHLVCGNCVNTLAWPKLPELNPTTFPEIF